MQVEARKIRSFIIGEKLNIQKNIIFAAPLKREMNGDGDKHPRYLQDSASHQIKKGSEIRTIMNWLTSFSKIKIHSCSNNTFLWRYRIMSGSFYGLVIEIRKDITTECWIKLFPASVQMNTLLLKKMVIIEKSMQRLNINIIEVDNAIFAK